MTHPYEVQDPDGSIYRVNTFEELIRLRRETLAVASQPNGASRPAPPPAAPMTNRGTKVEDPEAAQWDTVCNQVKSSKYGEEHKVLAAVLGSKKPLPTKEMMRAMGWKQHGQLGARIAGIGRICKAAGIPKDSLLIREGNQKRGFTFRPGPMLLKYQLPPVLPPEAGK
jgi:hypothetical protein